MAIARKIAYNVVFNVITKILSTILSLVSIGLITRYLGKDGFGNYSTVIAFFSFFAAIADLGIYSITAREISRPNADEKKILGNAFSLRILFSLLVFILSPLIVYFLPYSKDIKTGILISAAAFVFSSTYMVLNGVFQKNLAMDKVATIELLGKGLQVLIVFFAIKKDLGFTHIILAMLFSLMFNFFAVVIASKKYTPLVLQFDFTYWKNFLKESFPLGISALVVFIYFKIDTILLSIMKTSTDVGIYNAAYKIIESITFFPSMIVGLVFPIISLHIFDNKKEFIRISNETLKVFIILIIPFIIGTLFLADDIIKIIGGNAFNESANILRILIFALAFIFFGGLFNNILIAGNHQKKMLLIFIFCALFNVIANLIFIPKYSYNASAIISTITEFFVALFSFILVKKYLDYSPFIKNISGLLLSGFFMSLFLFIFNNYNFFILFIGSSIVYALSLWITKTITVKELLSIIKGA